MGTVRCKLFGKADMQRWRGLRNLEEAWDDRTRLMAKLVPRGTRVIEFGAGRRRLQRYLDPSCGYYPSDLVSRGPGTMVWDLNVRPLPDLSGLKPDVAVFGGVLEYLSDLPSIPPWLSRHVFICIASYECAGSAPGTFLRMRETLGRTRKGWVNTYSEGELRDLFGASGFACSEKVIWRTEQGDEPIFVFRKA
jgi:hypothetical protein